MSIGKQRRMFIHLIVCVQECLGCIDISSASACSACKWLAYGMTTVAFMGKWTD